MNRRVFLEGHRRRLPRGAVPAVGRTRRRPRRRATTPPKRLVIFFTHNGCLTDRWWPKVTTYTNGAGALTADMLKGQTLEPLTPYISKLLVPRGFRSMNAYGVGPVDRPARSGDGLEADLRDDRFGQQALRDGHVAGPRDRQADQPEAARRRWCCRSARPAPQIKEILSFSAPGHRVPGDRQPADRLQPADRRVRHRRHRRHRRPAQADWHVVKRGRASSISARPT